MNYNQKVLDKLDNYPIRSTDCLDILQICDQYVEQEKRKIKIQAVKNFSKLVTDYLNRLDQDLDTKEQRKKINESLKLIEKYK